MALNTQLNIVGNITKIFSAYVSPLKVSLHSLGDLIKTTKFTAAGFTKSTNYPVVLSSIRSLITFPKVVVFRSVAQTITLLGAVFGFSRSDLKRLATYNTFSKRVCCLDSVKALLRTELAFSTFNSARISFKNFVALLTGNFNHKIIIT